MSTKHRLIKRLKWYYPMEKFNSYSGLGLAVYLNYYYSFQNSLLYTYGLLVMSFIMFQGAHYWKLKLLLLLGQSIDQQKELDTFKKARKVNLLLLYNIPLIFLLQWFASGRHYVQDSSFYWGVIANMVAVLEHINYYHRQLMYDNIDDLRYLIRNRNLKTASLRKDLNENCL